MSFCVERVKRFVHVHLHCIVSNLKNVSKMWTFPPRGRISADAHWKGAWGHSNESFPITALRNTAERSFRRLRLIKTFHRSTMTMKN